MKGFHFPAPHLALAAACALGLVLHPVAADAQGATEWTAYGGDALGGRYSALREIDRGNVSRLQVAWTYHTGETRPEFATRRNPSLEATPLLVDGTLYLSTPLGRVIALDPATGVEHWTFDPRVDRTANFGDFVNRGVSTWVDPRAARGATCRRRILVATIDARLIALDSRTGRPCAGFGAGGTVNLRDGLRNPPEEPSEYEETSPPAVVNGTIVVGSAVADNTRTDAASGEVRGFDARTGALRWSWDPVPQDSTDPAWRTWIGPTAHRTGAANAWSVMAADPALDLVVIPTSSPSPDYFGGARKGDNRYANSVVALRASTGKLVWHFQTVHHDLWDYDNAAPPALVTIHRGGRAIPAVLQATKTGMLFVLDRRTGRPLFPVEERPVPRSDVPGEEASPTQPFSVGIAPLSPHTLRADEVWGGSAEGRAECQALLRGVRNEGIFTPPSLGGTIAMPSNVGGAHWGGLTFDSARQIAVVPTNRMPAMVQLIPRERLSPDSVAASRARGLLGWEYTDMRGTPYVMRRRILLSSQGMPCSPVPAGALTAVSLRTGEKLWEVPLGTPGRFAPPGASPEALARMGSFNLGGPISTAGALVFIAATMDAYLRAFDTETGRELWKGSLPAGGKATPMTYRLADGRQYVVVAAGGDGAVFGRSDAIVAFALPPAAR